MSELKYAEILKQNTIILCELAIDIIEYINSLNVNTGLNAGLLRLGSGFLASFSSKDIIDTFIIRSYEHWNKIKNRDELFLIDHSGVLFHGLPQEHVSNFSKIFQLTDENGEWLLPKQSRDSVWEVLDAMVDNSIRHIHKTRKWDPIEKKYKAPYCPGISVTTQKNIWNVKNLED
jgi:hypothetical protein